MLLIHIGLSRTASGPPFFKHEIFPGWNSLYRDYLYVGGICQFEAFLDVEGGTGQLRKSDLSSRGIIESVEVHFEHGPFLFLQEDFAADPVRFVSDLDAFVAAQTPVLEELNLAPRNDVGHYQARLLCWLNGLTRFWHNPHGLLLHSNPYTIFLRVEPRRVCQGWVDFLSRRPVRLPEEDQEAILEQYREDRAFVEDYSQKGQWV